MEVKLFLLLLQFVLNYDSVLCYCFGAGQNPGFTGPPQVSQIRLDLVRISWRNLVDKKECADNYVVKYWPKSAPNDYKLSELVDKNKNFVDLEVKPRVSYRFQAVAREEKGLIGGVDWNKSPLVDFTTSTHGQALAPSSETILNENGEEVSAEEFLLNEPNAVGSQPGVGQVDYSPDHPFKVFGLGIEIFLFIIVVCVIAILLFVGICYKMVKAKRAMDKIDDEDEDDDEGDMLEPTAPVNEGQEDKDEETVALNLESEIKKPKVVPSQIRKTDVKK